MIKDGVGGANTKTGLAFEGKTDLLKIINYLWKDEERHFEECDCPENHIFLVLKRIKSQIESSN